MSDVVEVMARPTDQEDRAQFGQLRIFTWRSLPTRSTKMWLARRS